MRADAPTDYREMTVSQLRDFAAEARRRRDRIWCRGNHRLRWNWRLYAAEYELALRELGVRPRGSGPTRRQRMFLELLASGKRSSFELESHLDFDDPALGVAVIDAQQRGWVALTLAGIGGMRSRPASSYDVTEFGPFGARPAAGVRATVAGVGQCFGVTPEMRG